ncbi:hypothetical protein HU200_005825 [Digitaria exilis]|uniref:F-box domain-containing protein n=1 Tax=Digitaria exilis TaxID=1010633 RepID=A0A835FR44_9POAL|nr:hypothetical protein HU200_005825 [Digitaria exilis]
MAPHRLRKKPPSPDATATPAPAVASYPLLSLPPEVVNEILTRLSLRDAVRTSALSRAWRRRWESLPSLDIDIGYGKQALWTVDCVLSRCSGRVRRFHTCLDELSARRLDDWLLVLSRRGGVEDLDLRPDQPYKFLSLHSTIFSWRRLISIDLFACHIPPLPQDFVGFPDLKVLSLGKVKLQRNGEYQLQEIIETSPLLEKLTLSELYIGEDGDDFIEWEIKAPNLRYITICSNIDYGWNFAELPCLHSAVIDLWEYVGHRDFAKFLAGLVQARKLNLCMYYAPANAALPKVNGIKILETLPCTFQNLKLLKLFMHFCELAPIFSLFCFLKSAPNLVKLKIKILKMTGINWLPNEMSFMKLMLSKARLLHTLSISHAYDCSVSHVGPLHELVTYGRASAQAQILFQDCVLLVIYTIPSRKIKVTTTRPDDTIEQNTMGISDLGPELLDLILARLPLRDAARASVLSVAWCRSWRHLSDLNFTSPCAAVCDREAIDGVLLHHAGPVRSVR